MILMQSHSILGAMDEWSVSSGFEYGPGGGGCSGLPTFERRGQGKTEP